MPYGRRYHRKRTYRRRRGRYSGLRSGYSGFKKRRRIRKSAVKPYPIQLASASTMPTKRKVLFQDTRTFMVKDEDGSGKPIMQILQLNHPANFWPTAGTPAARQGTWDATDYNAKGSAMPAVGEWVTNHDGSGDGKYRSAQVLGTKVTVTAVYVNDDIDAEEDHQGVSQLVVGKYTALPDIPVGINPSTVFNADVLNRQPFTKTANLYRNMGGTPKGATITMNSKFTSMNSLRRADQNFFWNDRAPGELDFLMIAIMPTNKNYALPTSGKNRCGTFRVCVQVEAIGALSEPNTKHGITAGEGSGNIFTNFFGQGAPAAMEPNADL